MAPTVRTRTATRPAPESTKNRRPKLARVTAAVATSSAALRRRSRLPAPSSPSCTRGVSPLGAYPCRLGRGPETTGVTRADEAASQSRAQRRQRVPAVVGVGLLALVGALRLGWPAGPFVFVGTMAGVLLLLWLTLRLSVERRRHHLPPGVLWRADAIVYGQETGAVRRRRPPCRLRRRGGRLVRGDGGCGHVAAQTALRRARRPDHHGALAGRRRDRDDARLVRRREAARRGRRVLRPRARCRSFAAFVTNPQPVHHAMASLGRPVIQLESGPPAPSVE